MADPVETVPLQVQFIFGKELDPSKVNTDQVITEELKDRFTKLLTGKFDIDEKGRCVLPPMNGDDQWNGEPRDSVCTGVNLFLVSFSYCKDV